MSLGQTPQIAPSDQDSTLHGSWIRKITQESILPAFKLFVFAPKVVQPISVLGGTTVSDERGLRVMPTVKPEPWVGTWRPHRPRGPIAALYGSPGPKYALPGLTGTATVANQPLFQHSYCSIITIIEVVCPCFLHKGSSKHDPTKYKAPMFSMGTRHKLGKSDSSPGPKYLIPSNVTRLGQDGTPAFSLQSRPKEAGLFQTPGPGKYSPEQSDKVIFRSAPAFSLSGRCKEVSPSQTPGPDTYNLPPVLGSKTVTTTGVPAYSLVGRTKTGSFIEDLKKTPGPAAYKVADPCIYKKKPPQFSMTGRNFPPGDTTKTPGPGAYSPEKVTFTRAKAPSFSLGLRHSEYITPLIADVSE
ncbi:ciliary microtubule associated protein 1B [Symphorus nematophorus]